MSERVRGRQRLVWCPGAVVKEIKDRNAVYILY